MNIRERVLQQFEERYGEEASVLVRAPGRVNLIGEHTDYNDGYALPMAIDRATWIALRPRDDQQVQLYALDFDSLVAFDLSNIERASTSPAEYIKGVAWAMREAGFALRGFEGVVGGDVPIGAGLSSSAALEMAVARAFAEVSGIQWDAESMAKLGQKAENKWVGVNSGLLDQLSSACGVVNHALVIDFRSLDVKPVPLPPGTVVAILNTNTSRELSSSGYNERRSQCEQAAAILGVASLRDAHADALEHPQLLSQDILYRRVKHILTENARVLAVADALQDGDAEAMGALMDESHVSMRDDYEISSRELDVMVEAAKEHPACFGSRMTGGGFGGCAIALIRADDVDSFVEATSQRYQERTGIKPDVYVCRAVDGASVEFSSWDYGEGNRS